MARWFGSSALRCPGTRPDAVSLAFSRIAAKLSASLGEESSTPRYEACFAVAAMPQSPPSWYPRPHATLRASTAASITGRDGPTFPPDGQVVARLRQNRLTPRQLRFVHSMSAYGAAVLDQAVLERPPVHSIDNVLPRGAQARNADAQRPLEWGRSPIPSLRRVLLATHFWGWAFRPHGRLAFPREASRGPRARRGRPRGGPVLWSPEPAAPVATRRGPAS